MTSQFGRTIPAISLAVVLASCTAAPTSPTALNNMTSPGGGSLWLDIGPLSSTDRQVLAFAAVVARTFAQLGNLAQARGDQFAVTQFGQQMNQENTLALEDLYNTSNGEVELHMRLDPREQAIYDALARLSGSDFDAAYMIAMVQLMPQAIQIFRQAAPSVKPKIAEHLLDRAGRLNTHLSTVRNLVGETNGF